MADEVKKAEKKAKKSKKNWFKGLKTEFKKIIWTDRKTLGKQTIAVIIITAIITVLITLVDSVGLQIMQLIIG